MLIQQQLRISVLENKSIAPLQQTVRLLPGGFVLQIAHEPALQVGHVVAAISGHHMGKQRPVQFGAFLVAGEISGGSRNVAPVVFPGLTGDVFENDAILLA